MVLMLSQPMYQAGLFRKERLVEVKGNKWILHPDGVTPTDIDQLIQKKYADKIIQEGIADGGTVQIGNFDFTRFEQIAMHADNEETQDLWEELLDAAWPGSMDDQVKKINKYLAHKVRPATV